MTPRQLCGVKEGQMQTDTHAHPQRYIPNDNKADQWLFPTRQVYTDALQYSLVDHQPRDSAQLIVTDVRLLIL